MPSARNDNWTNNNESSQKTNYQLPALLYRHGEASSIIFKNFEFTGTYILKPTTKYGVIKHDPNIETWIKYI